MAMDDDRLVCLVQKHPELYNKKSPLYKRTDRKRSVWEAIGKELQCPGEQRERFSKESQKIEAPSSSGGHSERLWPLLEPMMFLKQHIIPRPLRCSNNVCLAPQPQHEEMLSPAALSPETPLLDGHSTIPSPALQLRSEVTPLSPVLVLQSDVSCSGASESQSSSLSPNSPLPQRKPPKTKKKRKLNEDSVDELMLETIKTFKSHCEARETSQNLMVEGFANFIKSTLSTVDSDKQTRIIKHVTNIVMDAVADPIY